MRRKAIADPNQLLIDFSETEQKPYFVEGELESISLMLPQLYENQHKDVEKIENRFLSGGKGYLLTNGTGTGKAQPLYSEVMTPFGPKLMGEIKKGDFVIASDGKPTKITGVYPQGEKKIYEIILSDGSRVRCCDDHLWETQTLYERRKASGNVNWNCGKPKVRSLNEIRKTIDKQHFVPIGKPVEFKKVDLEIHPYLMGSLLGDGGFTTTSVIFTSNDYESVEKINSILPFNFELKKLKSFKKKCPQYRFVCIEKSKRNLKGHFPKNFIVQELKKFGLIGLKSNEKYVPEIYLKGSIEQRTDLLQGLLDTDGYCDKNGTPEFCSTSIFLANAVCYLARSLGGTAKISSKIPTYKYKDEIKNGLKAYLVRLNLPQGIVPFHLKRKACLYRANTKYPPRRKIVSVNYIHNYEAQCISIEDSRQLYFTNDFVLTHNTFCGLGLIKRFLYQEKSEVLIVVPTDKKINDWVSEAEHLDIEVHKITDVNDKGVGVSCCTYANFYQNKAIIKRKFDLIIYDESHYLMQNLQGKGTVYLDRHKELACLPSRAREKAHSIVGPYPSSELYESDRDLFFTKKEYWIHRMKTVTKELVEHTKVLFLSATPFAYHKSLQYADGTLWNVVETLEEKETGQSGYNVATGFDAFLVEHFGYTMKYGKLTRPDVEVDVDLLEREFFEKMKALGVMSTQQLQLKQDYSREFILLESELGKNIDKGRELLLDSDFAKRYPTISDVSNMLFNYIMINKLLESIKAKLIIPRIKEHLRLGRKVVLFHSYLQGGVVHPFRFDNPLIYRKLSSEDKWLWEKLQREYQNFKVEYPEFVNLDLNGLMSVPQTIQNAFPDVLLFNGKVPKKKRQKNEEEFNDDNSGKDVILLQSDAGREGISLHDTTSKMPRVLVDLGLPIKPTEAIQKEGRIYRVGLMSNAVYEYAIVNTFFEMTAFAEKVSSRSKTAENLAMGHLARDLENAFKFGYQNAIDSLPSLEQGVGGKKADKKIHVVDEFEKAVSYYFMRKKGKSNEGVDFYSTPEPLGYKMVEWAGIEPGNKVLEPSAGDGSIGRWFPKDSFNVYIEPSYELSGRLSLNVSGDIINDVFENHNIINKFDRIIMNPPFGQSGSLAYRHILKAVGHLRTYRNPKLIALIPNSERLQENIKAFLSQQPYEITNEIILPECVFKRVGTSIRTKIIIIELHPGPVVPLRTDLSYIDDINMFFKTIKNINV